MQSMVFGGSLVMVIAPERGQVGATLLTIENRATARKSSDCSQVLPCILPERSALLAVCLTCSVETTLSGGEVIVSLANCLSSARSALAGWLSRYYLKCYPGPFTLQLCTSPRLKMLFHTGWILAQLGMTTS